MPEGAVTLLFVKTGVQMNYLPVLCLVLRQWWRLPVSHCPLTPFNLSGGIQ